MKGIVLFKGKYGATMQYAIWVAAALNTQAIKAEFVSEKDLSGLDYVIIGTSVYIGKLQLANWLRQHAAWLKGKKLIFFIVAGTPLHETEKLRSYYEGGVPALLRDQAGVHFLPGSLRFKKLSLMDKLLLTMGSRMAKWRGENINTKDYNSVSREHIQPILNELHNLQPELQH
ncbi:flavodoxin domain-containing protein [Chitinophaga alhagiae]|uniref:flavodoxin domain-containing protein n=1 Tax=Chitinophaga alhagiae TaxID=2203219 RepID=UPI00130040DD|nr:flavodoxin domain-containing protein [Chitinophaga alhagiae]